MSFVSFSFFVFVAVCLLVYFLTPQRFRWMVLLAASLLFYFLVSGQLILYLLFTAATTYAVARCIEGIQKRCDTQLSTAERSEKKAIRAAATAKKRRALALAAVANFGLLVLFKYKGWIFSGISLLGNLVGVSVPDFTGSLLMPLGVSFYTFQSVGYVIDVYRSKVKAERSFPRYLLFVSFFPQIVQGPIARYGELAEQLYAGHGFDYARVKFGAQLAAWGVFKKLVIADRAAIVVATVFGGYPEFTGRTIWLGALFYTLQIYTDFSGGIDIARGIGQMLGVTMAENFERPYFARSIAEFWRRWHMTLGGWCRDYIFYPLSLSKGVGKLSKKTRKWFGNRIGKMVPVICSQLVVFLIIGMWHGSQFKYIAFGLYHGAFIIGGIVLEEPFARLRDALHIDPKSWWFQGFGILRTFAIVTAGRVITCAGSFLQSLAMFRDGVLQFGAAQPDFYSLGLEQPEMQVLGIAVAILLVVDVLGEKGVVLRQWLAARPALLRWAVYVCGLLVIIIYGVYGTQYDSTAFIYMRF